MYAMPPYPYLATELNYHFSLTTFGLVVSVLLVLVRMLIYGS
jgi:hypothetical protein